LDDIEGAQNAGMHGILVKTGKYRANDESKLSQSPLFVSDNFSSAVEFLLKNSSA
jgi:ribonucleotide monophosphatase NagD (HAD superfamily)